MQDKEYKHIDKEKAASAANSNGHFVQLGKIVTGYLNTAKPTDGKSKPELVPPPVYPKLRILTFLKPIPWILMGLFLFSFVWDFDGITIQLFGLPLYVDGLLRIISVSGMIGFVGLMVPYLARRLVGVRHRLSVPMCGLLGAMLLTGGDMLSRSLIPNQELPIGIITAGLGGAFIVSLLLRAER